MTYPFWRAALRVLLILAIPLSGLSANKAGKATRPATAPAPQVLQTMTIAYLGLTVKPRNNRPFFDPPVDEAGQRGARLGIEDNNTTGQFTHQQFRLEETLLPHDGDPLDAFRSMTQAGHRFFLVDLPASQINRLADLPEARDSLLLDIGSRDNRLRDEECRANVLHLLPSRAMRTDALAQFLTQKRWKRWFLAKGPEEEDQLYAESLKRSAKKFGAKIIEERAWSYQPDTRRTPESEIPVFTQKGDYDVVVVADESGEFGEAFPYRTWKPQLVAGTAGLVATAWHQTHEAWGALQLQNRFFERTGRWMDEKDYGSWLAIRALGEAASRSGSVEFEAVRRYLVSEHFTLAGFKGVPLSFRPWDHQLRQPLLLVTERSEVAVAPIEGYLHPKNALDTLGFDEPETHCRFPAP